MTAFHSYLPPVLGLVLAAASLTASGAAPRLLEPLISGGSATLRLQGDAGTHYRIEASTNLLNWAPVGSGVAQGGLLTVQHAGPATAPWTYYRGVQAGAATPFPSVTPDPSTNDLATVVVFPDQPAELRVETPGRVIYTLAFPTNTFPEPTLVTLTALARVGGIPTAQGLLAGVRLDPEGLVPQVPVFLQIDFPKPLDARHVSSFAFDNAGSRLHLVPDVVVSQGATQRVRILVNQLRSHGCGLFTLAELESLAAATPPPRVRTAAPSLHASLEECYPDDERDARNLQEELEDLAAPRMQEAAEILGADRQRQLLGIADESEGLSALGRVLESSQEFYTTELESRIPQALEKCATVQTLAPWVLGHHRQMQLLGAGADGPPDTTLVDLLCGGSRRCQEQALQCCRTQGGDTRLIGAVLGSERQRQLLGGGPECGAGIDLDQLVKECAPAWYGTLSMRISGRYLNISSNGAWRIRRTKNSDLVVSATVLSARVRVNAASIFAAASTNITCVLGGDVTGSDHMERLEEYLDQFCDGKPGDLRRDVWESSASTNLADIQVEAVIMAPGTDNFFSAPSLRVLGAEANGPFRWSWLEQHAEPSPFTDEPCDITEQSGGTYDPDDGAFGTFVYAQKGEFTYTADSIQYRFHGPEPMQFDFEHHFEGIKDINLELHRVVR